MDKDKIDKKDHILDVAERVFADMGYEGASTRLISGEAGVNMAMLNYYFGSKEGLFLAIFERKILFFQALLQHLGSEAYSTSWEKIEKYIDLYSERVVNNNCFQKILYQEMATSRRSGLTDKLTEMMMINLNEFRRIVSDGIANGEFNKDTDANMVAATIYGTKNFLINTPHVSSLMLEGDIGDEKFLEEQVKPRLKNYLKTLLKSYLLEKHDNTTK
jgi:TetR/AcrR family transcriptional regulator